MRMTDRRPIGRRGRGGHRLALTALAALGVIGCDPSARDERDSTPPRDGSVPDALPPPTVWTSLSACGLTGRFHPDEVGAPFLSCGWDLLGGEPEVLVIEEVDGVARLRVGQIDVPLAEAEGECAFAATGCTADAERGDSTTIDGTLSATADGLTLDFTPRRIRSFRPADCEPIHLVAEAVPRDACGFNGRFRLDGDPALVAGQCDLEWSDVPIEVSFADGGGTITWGETRYGDVEFDAETCTFEVDGGLVFLNDAQRTTRILGAMTPEGLRVTIEDALDGADRLGRTCVEARFEGEATRRQPPEVEPLDDVCDPLPRICGDGICADDGGETCGNCVEDCGCPEGIGCGQFADGSTECREPCEVDDDCPGAERCESRICRRMTAPVGASGVCADNLDCIRGTYCENRQCRAPCEGPRDPACPWCESRAAGYLCMPPCDTRQGACPDDHYCGAQVDWRCTDDRPAGRNRCIPTPYAPYCHPLPETLPTFGEPCDERSCVAGLLCLGVRCTGSSCEAATCTRACTDPAECAEPLPVCSPMFLVGFDRLCLDE